LLSAVNYLHSANIVHRDIQLTSILLKMSDEVDIDKRQIISFKLSNFQHSRSLVEPFLDTTLIGPHTHKKISEFYSFSFFIGT